MKVDTHVVDIDPPNERRNTWLATCSFKDYAQSYLNRVDARLGASTHIDEVTLANELVKGTYQFRRSE